MGRRTYYKASRCYSSTPSNNGMGAIGVCVLVASFIFICGVFLGQVSTESKFKSAAISKSCGYYHKGNFYFITEGPYTTTVKGVFSDIHS